MDDIEHGANNSLFEPLKSRELEVLRLIGKGLSNREVANELVISLQTVKWYCKQIYSKLGVNSRGKAVTRASELEERGVETGGSATISAMVHTVSISRAGKVRLLPANSFMSIFMVTRK